MPETLSGIIMHCNFTNLVGSDYLLGYCNFTNRAESRNNIPLYVDFAKTELPEFGYIQMKCNFIKGNYLPSFKTMEVSSPEELQATFADNVYIVCPDIGEAYPVPYEDLISVSSMIWFADTPITCQIQLKNNDGKYTNPDEPKFGNLIQEGIWSPERNTRKFIAIEKVFICDDAIRYILFPQFVIIPGGVSGTDLLTISLIDCPCEYLYRVPSWKDSETGEELCPSYCFEEALVRNDDDTYLSITLTNFYYDRNKNSEFYINCQQVTSGFSLDEDTRHVTVNSNLIENFEIPVVLRNPMGSKEIINGDNGLLKRIINIQTEDIPKDYINVDMQFTDFLVYAPIQTQDLTVIEILKRNIFDAIPANFMIMPVMNWDPIVNANGYIDRELNALAIMDEKFTLRIQDCILENEISEPEYNLTPILIREENPIPKILNLNKINGIRVVHETVTAYTYTLQTPATPPATPAADTTPPVTPIIPPQPAPPIVWSPVILNPYSNTPNPAKNDIIGFTLSKLMGSGLALTALTYPKTIEQYNANKELYDDGNQFVILWDNIIYINNTIPL